MRKNSADTPIPTLSNDRRARVWNIRQQIEAVTSAGASSALITLSRLRQWHSLVEIMTRIARDVLEQRADESTVRDELREEYCRIVRILSPVFRQDIGGFDAVKEASRQDPDYETFQQRMTEIEEAAQKRYEAIRRLAEQWCPDEND